MESGLVGRKIVAVRRLTKEELEAEGWDYVNEHSVAATIILDDGTRIFASSDDEGNGVGTLFGVDTKGEQFYIIP